MHIVGIDLPERDETHVHSIDMWFSNRRQIWIVERLNADGDPVGVAHHCASREGGMDCLAEWVRAHGETHLVLSLEDRAVGGAAGHKKRRAA